MKKIAIVFLSILFTSAQAQTVLLNEDFESYPDFTITNFGGWSLLDLDQLDTTNYLGGDPAPPINWVANWPNAGSKMAFQIFNFSQSNATNDFIGTSGDIRNFNPRSGQKYAACWAGRMVQSYQGNNDWLIAPAVTLGASGNQISMYLKSLSSSYGDERFQVGVYVGNGNPTKSEDFVIINTLPYQTVPQNLNIDNNWRDFIYNLDDYLGQTIRVGIRCITQEASALLVDDVKITTIATLNVSENNQNRQIETYPNPVQDELYINSDKKVQVAKLYNLDGKLLQSFSKFPLSTKGIATGNYVIQILFEDGSTKTRNIQKK
ncbi:MAG: T9SS type A sorting domain-containing protein [Chryseobacterium sp.]|nr:T9SS type A sorting domain-containing protein [Chryseobacterium sp.]MBP7498331.1 T9SS type A sorting domain-containing protein [Chryseobacterium sp.]